MDSSGLDKSLISEFWQISISSATEHKAITVLIWLHIWYWWKSSTLIQKLTNEDECLSEDYN